MKVGQQRIHRTLRSNIRPLERKQCEIIDKKQEKHKKNIEIKEATKIRGNEKFTRPLDRTLALAKK
jgi:hypothetical protein